MKYKKKPVVIEAIQYDGEWKPIIDWLTDDVHFVLQFMTRPPIVRNHEGFLEITTLEGVMTAQPGDWIICGVKGEFYPCKDDIFQATYEPAE